MIVLSLDIGGTHLRIGAIDQGGTVLKFEKLPTASVIHSDHVLSDLSDFLRSFLRACPSMALRSAFRQRSTGPGGLLSRLRTFRLWRTCRYVITSKRNSLCLFLPSGM